MVAFLDQESLMEITRSQRINHWWTLDLSSMNHNLQMHDCKVSLMAIYKYAITLDLFFSCALQCLMKLVLAIGIWNCYNVYHTMIIEITSLFIRTCYLLWYAFLTLIICGKPISVSNFAEIPPELEWFQETSRKYENIFLHFISRQNILIYRTKTRKWEKIHHLNFWWNLFAI